MASHMNTAGFPFTSSQATTPADAALTEALRGCARRSLPALQRLHELTAPRLLGLLVQMLEDRQDAENALQECYLDIWAQAASFSPERCRPYHWLLGVARQQAIRRLRAPHLHGADDEADAALQLVDASLQAGEVPPVAPALQVRLAAVAADAQRCLRLAYLTGRSPPQLARALGWSVSRVRHSLHAALAALGP